MNWIVFFIFAYVFAALQKGLAPLFDISTQVGGGTPIRPQFMLLLAVTIGFYAPTGATLVAWAMIGLALDLTATYAAPDAAGAMVVVGPSVFGYLAGGFVILQLRTMVFRQHPLSTGFCMLVCGIAAQLVIVLMLSLRGVFEPMPGWSALPQLIVRSAGVAYGAALGTLLAIPMNRMSPLFGFQVPKSATRRRKYGG